MKSLLTEGGQLIALNDQHIDIYSIALHKMTFKLLCPSSPVAYKVDQITCKYVVCLKCDGR